MDPFKLPGVPADTTIIFSSDSSDAYPGFTLNWKCEGDEAEEEKPEAECDGMEIFNDSDFYLGDIGDSVTGITTWEDCAEICAKNEACNFFTHSRRWNKCYLKDSPTEFRSCDYCTGGAKCSVDRSSLGERTADSLHQTTPEEEARCPTTCWDEVDGACVLKDSAGAECFNLSCEGGKMNIDFDPVTMFKSQKSYASSRLSYSSDVGSDPADSAELNWGTQTISFTDDLMVSTVVVDSDALNDPAISCLSTLESANQTLVTGVSEEPCLSVSFKCEFPRIMTVTSDPFQVTANMIKGTGEDKKTGNLESTLSMTMRNKDGDAVTSDNVFLGDQVTTVILSSLSTTKFSMITEQCEVNDNGEDVAIVKNYCYAGAVKASFGQHLVQTSLMAQVEWNTFTVGSVANPLTSQTVTCKVKLCGADCRSLAESAICPADSAGLEYVKGSEM